MREHDVLELLNGTADAGFAVGIDGTVRHWNRAAEALFGVSAGEAVHRPCATLLEGVDATGAPVCCGDCPVIQIAAQGLPVPCFDLKVKLRAGTTKWVNLSVLHTRTPEKELLVIHLARDVTVRKRLETVTRRFLAQVGALTGQDIEHLLSPAPAPHLALTARELEILQLLARGLSTRSVSQELNIHEITVRNHIQHILQKLSAHSRTEAVLRAVREHIVS